MSLIPDYWLLTTVILKVFVEHKFSLILFNQSTKLKKKNVTANYIDGLSYKYLKKKNPVWITCKQWSIMKNLFNILLMEFTIWLSIMQRNYQWIGQQSVVSDKIQTHIVNKVLGAFDYCTGNTIFITIIIVYTRNLQLPMLGQRVNQQTLGRLNLLGITCLPKVNQVRCICTLRLAVQRNLSYLLNPGCLWNH